MMDAGGNSEKIAYTFPPFSRLFQHLSGLGGSHHLPAINHAKLEPDYALRCMQKTP
jgi:hypothetical protein